MDAADSVWTSTVFDAVEAVWAALGMYPQVPGRSELVLASPQFSEITIRRGNGATISITAPGSIASTSRTGIRVRPISTVKAISTLLMRPSLPAYELTGPRASAAL